MQAIGKTRGVFDRLGQIVEERFHFARRFSGSVRCWAQQTSGGIEVRVIADAGEDVVNLAGVGFCVEDAVCREEWEARLFGELDKGVVDAFFAAEVVALDLDKDTITAKDVNEALNRSQRKTVETVFLNRFISLPPIEIRG